MSAQQKEDRLFENIYLSYFPKMKRFAQEYVISEQDAENIVQDMFAELWEKREMFTCQTIRIAYLFTIIKNKCLNHLRHKTIALETINNMQEEYNMTLRMNLDSLEAFEQHIFSDQDIEDLINRALDSLPTKCKEIFIMNKLEGKKQEQIATELNLSTNICRNSDWCEPQRRPALRASSLPKCDRPRSHIRWWFHCTPGERLRSR